MLKRIFPALALSALLFTSPGQSQVQTGDPNQDAMIQQMQEMAQQIQQNMQQQGIDPQTFADQMRQQYQDGNFDPQAMQQQLIDSGLVSQELMTRMTGTVQQLALNAIRQRLASTDEEWAVLQPRMQRVVAAMADVGQPGPNNQASQYGMRMIMGGQNAQTPVTLAKQDLQAAVDDPNTSIDQLTRKLNAWRDVHEAAKIELGKAREDLRIILTLRQEAVLLGMGVLD